MYYELLYPKLIDISHNEAALRKRLDFITINYDVMALRINFQSGNLGAVSIG